MSDDEEEQVGMQDDGLEDAGGQAYTMNLRMYEEQFPEIDDVVMVQVGGPPLAWGAHSRSHPSRARAGDLHR